VNIKGENNETAIFLATRYGAHKILDYLCKIKGADLNVVEELTGHTPLLHAVETNDIESVKILCRNGADYKIIDSYGKTAIELATDKNVKAALAKCVSRGGRRKMTRRRKMKRSNKTKKRGC
jgi:ankyrin repeat protein